jgi:inositol transporter-like SP family MFS transporter
VKIEEVFARRRFIMLDGAMGTQLQLRGLTTEQKPELAAFIMPDVLTAVHRDYARAGADILLANTFGQFQTYILVKANASQSLATGCGIVLNIVGLICGILFASAAGSKHRNKFFYVGIVIQAAAMIGIALGGGTIAMIVAMIACYNIGNQFAGESIYKVWTQESFPSEARASMQGFINGFSRFCCGLFALVTPYLVAGNRIHTTMYGFAGIVVISAIAGTMMIRLQKKHGIGQM